MKEKLWIDDLRLSSYNTDRRYIANICSHIRGYTCYKHDIVNNPLLKKLFLPSNGNEARVFRDGLIQNGHKRIIAMRLAGILELPPELYLVGNPAMYQPILGAAEQLQKLRRVSTVGEFVDLYMRTTNYKACSRLRLHWE